MSNKSFFIFVLTVVLLSVGSSFFAQKDYPRKEGISSIDLLQQGQQARELWEKAIRAKGGREKLLQIKSVVETSTAEYTTHKGRQNTIKKTELSVFPDKYWSWEDMRPDVFGLRVDMSNYETRMAYVVTPDSRQEDALRPVSFSRWDKDASLLYPQIFYFMETKWVKPEPISIYSVLINGQNVQVIRTDVFGQRFDLVIDNETNLPIRFIAYGTINGKEVPTVVTDLSDYLEINGIKMPQKATPEKGITYTSKFELNPEYNKDIFEKPTGIDAGPEAWRAKR